MTYNVKFKVDRYGNYKINQYIIIKKLGQGSYGKVCLCKDATENLYAIKIVQRSSNINVRNRRKIGL